jgi:hypothetical protein
VSSASAIALICAGIALGLVQTGQPRPTTAAGQTQAIAAILHGAPLRPGPRLGALLLGGPGELRLLKLSNRVPATLGRTHGAPGAIWSGPLGSRATVPEIASVSGGVVVLLSDDAVTGYPAIADVFFVAVTSRGLAAPRLIARANYLAVAPNRRDIWVEQTGAPLGRKPGRAWLIDESGRRLSADLQLHSQILLAATAGGLLTQGPSGEGASLISPASGAMRPAGVPGNALVVAVGPDDVAWQPANCGDPCSLHITSLRHGTNTVMPLPLGTLPDTSYPPPGAFDIAGQRLALAMDTTNREDRVTSTSVYVADIGSRRLTPLPGGLIPLSPIPASLGAIPAGSPDIVSVRWAGSGLWIVATDGEDSQAAYWSGSGPLHVVAPVPGAAYTFDVVTDPFVG